MAFDDSFISLDATDDIIRFNGENFLQGKGSAVSFESPNLHLAETLTAELSLAAERLLSDEGIRAGGTSVNFVVNEMMKFKHVNATDSNAIVERLAGAPVEENRFTVRVEAGKCNGLCNIRIASAIENGSGDIETGLSRPWKSEMVDIEAERFKVVSDIGIAIKDTKADSADGHAEMSFKNLADIHARGHAQRVEYDINGSTVRQEGHIFLTADIGDDAFVTVPTGHFIADGDFAFLSNVNAYLTIDAGGHFVVIVASENIDGNDFTGFAVRDAQAGITNFASLFAEDSAKESFFSSEFGFTFRSDFADENITGTNVGADRNNAVGIKVSESIFGYVGDIASNFFGSKFSVAGVALIFLNVNGSIDIAFD